LLATLAIWAALLRTPFYGAAALVLAAGLARPVSSAIVALIVSHRRLAKHLFSGLVVALIVLAGLSSGRQVIRERLALAGLPPPPPNAQNVVLIFWNTIRAASLSLHDYPRDTTPTLVRWARTGIQFNVPLAPAPWTFVSQSCFHTGQWPIVDLLGLAKGAPFPGRSLTALWKTAPGQISPKTTPAFSELALATADRPQTGLGRRRLQMSLVAMGRHYVREGSGTEQLFDLVSDPFETTNLASSPESAEVVYAFSEDAPHDTD
jgi:hypothetical protein